MNFACLKRGSQGVASGNSRSQNFLLAVATRHPVRFAVLQREERREGEILKFQMNPLSRRWDGNTSSRTPKDDFPRERRQSSLFRALNNVGTWVTYWKRVALLPAILRSIVRFLSHSSCFPSSRVSRFFSHFRSTLTFQLFLSRYRLPILFARSSRSTWSAQSYKLPTIPYLSDLRTRSRLAAVFEAVIPAANSTCVQKSAHAKNSYATWYKSRTWDLSAMIYRDDRSWSRNCERVIILTWFLKTSQSLDTL